MPRLTRTRFLAATAVLVAAPSALADPLPDADLANARLLVAVELLLVDFYTRALAAKQLGVPGVDSLHRARANEQEHLTAVTGILTGAGQIPSTAADIDFSYPAKAFASRGDIAKLGMTLERLALGAYLGAVGAVRDASLKQSLARIAACEGQHLGFFLGESTGHELGQSFPDALGIDTVSDQLGRYTS